MSTASDLALSFKTYHVHLFLLGVVSNNFADNRDFARFSNTTRVLSHKGSAVGTIGFKGLNSSRNHFVILWKGFKPLPKRTKIVRKRRKKSNNSSAFRGLSPSEPLYIVIFYIFSHFCLKFQIFTFKFKIFNKNSMKILKDFSWCLIVSEIYVFGTNLKLFVEVLQSGGGGGGCRPLDLLRWANRSEPSKT